MANLRRQASRRASALARKTSNGIGLLRIQGEPGRAEIGHAALRRDARSGEAATTRALDPAKRSASCSIGVRSIMPSYRAALPSWPPSAIACRRARNGSHDLDRHRPPEPAASAALGRHRRGARRRRRGHGRLPFQLGPELPQADRDQHRRDPGLAAGSPGHRGLVPGPRRASAWFWPMRGASAAGRSCGGSRRSAARPLAVTRRDYFVFPGQLSSSSASCTASPSRASSPCLSSGLRPGRAAPPRLSVSAAPSHRHGARFGTADWLDWLGLGR